MYTTGIDPAFEHYLRDIPGLTYASDDQHWFARSVTRSVEAVLGRRRLEGLYWELKNERPTSQEFLIQALARSGIHIDADYSPLATLDTSRPTLFLANHPFGVIDGLVLCNIALRVAGDFRVVINSLLCQDRELARHFLPIDFAGTREAERRNVRAKQLASEALKNGIPLVLFPSGMVSTAGRFGLGSVHDGRWTTFAAKLVRQHQPTIVPVYFHGQNSRPFHIASHVAEPLRMAMLMHEALRLFGKTIKVDIGDPLSSESYAHIEGRQALTEFLYQSVQDTARIAQD